MSFTLKSNVSLSAAAKKRDPAKYRWFTLVKGRAKFDSAHDEFELVIGRGENFGLKFFKGSYFLVDESDLTVQFKLTVDEANKLMANSKGYNGKIAGKVVRPGDDAPKPKRGGAKKLSNLDPKPAKKLPVSSKAGLARGLSKRFGVEFQDIGNGSHNTQMPAKDIKRMKEELVSEGWTHKEGKNMKAAGGGKGSHHPEFLVSPDGKRSIALKRKSAKTYDGGVSIMR